LVKSKDLEQGNLTRDILLVTLIFAPGLLNDFAYMKAETAQQWLAIDYTSKFLALAFVLLIPSFRKGIAPFFALGRPSAGTIVLTVIATAIISNSYFFVKAPLDEVFQSTKLFDYPEIESKPLYYFDLGFGLALNAVSEEVAARGVFRHVVERYTSNKWFLVIVSSLAFALLHWSTGIGNSANAFVAGVILMLLYLRTNSLWPPIVAHYFANVFLFM